MLTVDRHIDFVEKIELARAEVGLRTDGIMYFRINDGEILELDDSKQIVDAIKRIGEGKPYPNLVVVGKDASVDSEARAFAASEEGNIYTVADAVVIHSFAQQLVGNFYIRFNKPIRPTRLFNSEARAIQWLHRHYL